MAFIIFFFFFLKKFEKVKKTGIISTKFSLRCTPSVILGMAPLPSFFANNVPRHTSISFRRSHLLFSPEFQQNEDPNSVDVCFSDRNSDRKKVKECHFFICRQNFGTKNSWHQKSSRNSSAIQVGKAVGFANQILIKQHILFCLVRKKGLDRFVNHIETRPPVIR